MIPDEVLQFVQTKENIGVEFVKKARKWRKGIYLYGAGHHLRYVVKFMYENQIDVNAILDSRQNGVYNGLPIIHFSDFLASQPDSNAKFVISAPSANVSIRKTLTQYFPDDNIFFFDIPFTLNAVPDIEKYRDYLIKNWNKLSQLYDNLADQKSRDTLVSVIKGRISGIVDYFQNVCEPNQYYCPDIVSFTENEVMVELGSNDGDTLLQFLKYCPNYKSIYCFEPETRCLPNLRKISAEARDKIHIIPKGAWDCNTVLKFTDDDKPTDYSHIVASDEECSTREIEVTRVDDVVREKISYMKMDIEGSELRALHGARTKIIENHPQLAICVYHKQEDILDIWNYLYKLVPEYQFYLRHHLCVAGTETVLYAVDRSRRVEWKN